VKNEGLVANLNEGVRVSLSIGGSLNFLGIQLKDYIGHGIQKRELCLQRHAAR